jgi:hypothetical protein
MRTSLCKKRVALWAGKPAGEIPLPGGPCGKQDFFKKQNGTFLMSASDKTPAVCAFSAQPARPNFSGIRQKTARLPGEGRG